MNLKYLFFSNLSNLIFAIILTAYYHNFLFYKDFNITFKHYAMWFLKRLGVLLILGCHIGLAYFFHKAYAPESNLHVVASIPMVVCYLVVFRISCQLNYQKLERFKAKLLREDNWDDLTEELTSNDLLS